MKLHDCSYVAKVVLICPFPDLVASGLQFWISQWGGLSSIEEGMGALMTVKSNSCSASVYLEWETLFLLLFDGLVHFDG
jgi:hypothetical protein